MGKNILFVCTGNTCRSSMAEVIAKKIIKDNPQRLSGCSVTSAGTYAEEGAPAANNAMQIVGEQGLCLQNFKAKAIFPQLIKEADLILTMTKSHKEQLLHLAPDASGKVYLLKEYGNSLKQETNAQEVEVRDPFGQPLEVYRNSYQELYQAIEKVFNLF